MFLFRTTYTIIATINKDRNKVGNVKIGKIVMLRWNTY